MELLEEIKSSLEKQSRKQARRPLYPSSYRTYISRSLYWHRTTEGYLFWNILHTSYYYYGIYDYVTLVKLYHRYSRDVFKYDISIVLYYFDYFDKDTYTLTDDGFELLCKCLESYGAIRRD